ncbi:hypothetical protein C2E21_5514 [Chlorella sorokiniana]|uniref:Uncharacterized protein n=1 Tax=Chlorella sorokiniana TaxID=3076 RepID=A0A2P6TP56_CHLSO|nr:hypothetical protein C2E21_5514 [Chlorella sorokiniana]|eukprot:PRW51121.1 hypothetical protein C2E21_5514 [Chlorella sorokiniana]
MPLPALALAPYAWAPPTATSSGRPAPAAALPSRLLWQRRRRQTMATAGAGGGQPHPEESEGPQGDSKLQDSLVNQLQFEIGKKRVEEFVEEEAEGLKAKAEEAKEELDKLADLQNLRAEVAFNSALADINREADEFEEQLRRSREEREAAERDLEAWEDDVAVARSQGQFFQSLYQTKAKRPVGLNSEQLQERAQKVVQPARTEMGSRLRYYLFAFLAFVLASEVVFDLQSDAPSALQDVIYTLLVIALGVTAFNERKSLP